MSGFVAVLTALAPSLGVGAIFYFVMRWILRADRNERRQLREMDERLAESAAIQNAVVAPSGSTDEASSDVEGVSPRY